MTSSFNWADWTIVAIVGVSCLFSLLRGFVKEALSLLTWIAATFVAITFHERLAVIYMKWISTPSIRDVLAYATLFIVTLLLGALINHLIHTFIDASGLGGLDRLLGMAFGLARGLLIVLALLMTLPMLLPAMKQDSWWQQSKLIPHFEASEYLARDTFGHLLSVSKSLSHKVGAAPTSR